MSEQDSWQILHSGETTLLRAKFEPGFVTLQSINLGTDQQTTQVNTIKLRNEWWLQLQNYKAIKRAPTPWIQNPDKVSEALGLENKEKPAFGDPEEVPL